MSAVLLGTLFCSLAGIAQAEDSSTYDTTLRSTTWVLAKNSEGTSSGTGVLIDLEKKLIITNAHVVGDARAAVIFFPDITNGKPVVKRQHYLDNVTKLGIRGRVLAIDRKRDLALIELEKLPADATAIEMAAESIGPGQKVESIGNPGSTEALWVYTSGTVRAVYRKQFRTGAGEHDFMVVDTQSPINSGDSGGPVVNSQGQLVAIAQAIAPNARLVSYSVDITEVKTFMASPWKPAPLPVADVLKNAELTYKQHATGHYEIEMELTKDQKETVFVTKDIEYYERVDVRKIWALAQSSKEAPKAEIAMKLLEQNARTKLGAWTIEKTEAGEHLIIYMVKLDATATPDVTKSAIEYVARLTQAMKKELNPSKDAQSASDTLNAWLSN
jgi:serine protease Do